MRAIARTFTRPELHGPSLLALLSLLLFLAACDDYEPREKKAVYDPMRKETTLPHPCPDWSHNAARNYDNSLHSNYGCATANNMAIQLENPRDLHRGHGTRSPDAGITSGVIEAYRAGDLPQPLVPQQATGSQ